jgi:23S rRNA (cytidine1920-2'-O)/16S rRNA (cytidine1409-2'-O)-methyltransferase
MSKRTAVLCLYLVTAATSISAILLPHVNGKFAIFIFVQTVFEVGKAAIGKGGIVRDAKARQRAVAGIVDFIAATPGWRVLGTMESPLPGGDGNIEYLLAASKA